MLKTTLRWILHPKIKLDEHQSILLTVTKKQTLLVGIVCFSTVMFWSLFAILVYCVFCAICDAIVNILCIFLSLGYTTSYCEKLICNKLSNKLYGCVERYAISKLIDKANAMKQTEPEMKTWVE